MKPITNSNQLLSQMQQLSKLAKAGSSDLSGMANISSTKTEAEFGKMLSNAVNAVNQQQMEAGRLTNQVETGDGGVSLVKAMIASQKASIAFQAVTEARNKLVGAYEKIMNMPI